MSHWKNEQFHFKKGLNFGNFTYYEYYMRFYFSSSFEVFNWLCWELLIISRHFPLSFTVSEKNSTEICQEVANSANLMHCWGLLLLLYFCKMFIFIWFVYESMKKSEFANFFFNWKKAQIPKIFMLRKVYIIDFDVFFLEMIVRRA